MFQDFPTAYEWQQLNRTDDPNMGAGMIGYGSSNTYAAGTVGAKLNNFVVVTDDGADPTGVADSYAAFAAAWSKIKSTGGMIFIPPGTYLLNTQWKLDVDMTLPHNYKVIGYGAELKAGAAVTGHAIQVYKGFNNFGVTIEGLQFNHRNNTTVNGCIEGQGANNLHVINCSVEHHNTKAGYSGIKLGPFTPTDAGTVTYWANIYGFRTRQRTGGDGTDADYGVRLTGQCNSTRIRSCTFSNVNTAILLEEDTDPAAGMANGVNIRDNAFEAITTCVSMVMTPTTGNVPYGLLIDGNRVEAVTTFVSITTGGAPAIDAATPPIIQNNYLTNGSVTNELVNPNNQYVVLDNPSFYAPSSFPARLQYNNSLQLRLRGTQSNLELGNESGNSNYSVGHLVIGAYHLWVEVGTGKLRIKGSAPTADNDGTVVGTQA
jgi:hypothetical protein